MQLHIKLVSDQVSSELGEEVVILHLTSGQYYGLNGVGAVVWQKLQNPVSLTDLETHVLNEFDVKPEILHSDLQTLLQDLTKAGLVEPQK